MLGFNAPLGARPSLSGCTSKFWQTGCHAPSLSWPT